MTPTLTRSMLSNKHEGEPADEIARADAKVKELIAQARRLIAALDPTTQEKA